MTLDASKGLNAVIVGEDIVNAVAGDSQQFTIQLSGTRTGTQQLTFTLDGVQAVDSSTSSVNIDVTAWFDETDAGSNTVVFIGAGVALVVGLLAALLILRGKSAPVKQEIAPTMAAPVQQQQAPTCWSCRGPILGPMRGCPVCGARYHADAPTCKPVEKCANCGASAEQFVMA